MAIKSVNSPHLYFNLIPESLVASQLGPVEYGNYLAVGLHGKTRGQAIFFELEPSLAGADFEVAAAFGKCVDQSLISPKHSVYISIYRVAERLPLEALGRLYLATDDGRVLGLDAAEFEADPAREFHLYQELVPVKPRVVSRLAPREFCEHITSGTGPVHLPTMVFAEMILRELATDPAGGMPGNLPYPDLEHLRDCILTLVSEPAKQTKLVIRHLHRDLLYRTVRNGFFVGNSQQMIYYPMPSLEALENEHHDWWRSALTVSMD